MPGMPRVSKKGNKIAFSILGTPANIAYKPNKKKKEIDARLLASETQRVR